MDPPRYRALFLHPSDGSFRRVTAIVPEHDDVLHSEVLDGVGDGCVAESVEVSVIRGEYT
jgi:hypothetical protein